MADLAQLETALRNADAAGDSQAAQMIAAEIRRQRSAPVIQPVQQATYDPTQGMSTSEKLLAGAGKAFVDLGRGAGQLLRGGIGESAANRLGLPTAADIEESRRLDAPLMRTGAGTIGNVAGSVAAALPTAFIPGANTIGGAALLGAAQGALQPVGEKDSRLQNIGTGALFGAAVPAAIKTAQIGKAALIDPITDAGRARIVAKALRRAASNPEQAAQNLATRTAATPGFQPTAGQLADDAGLASLERAARAIQPAEFGDIDTSQQAALVNALRGVAGTPEQRAAAIANANQQAKGLYGQAFKENVEVTPELAKLASRPSMRMAESRAKDLASELAIPFQTTLENLRPQYVSAGRPNPLKAVVQDSEFIPPKYEAFQQPVRSEYTLPGAAFDAYRTTPQVGPQKIPVYENIQRETKIPGTGIYKDVEKEFLDSNLPNVMMEIPPLESVPVRDLHTVKMAMDALLKDPTKGLAGREASAIAATREKLLDILPENYQVARQAHIENMRPVNQQDIGQELYNRFVPALSDASTNPFRTRAQSLAQALREGDQLAKNVTGMKNAKLENIMTPEQMGALRGVVSDSAMRAAAQEAGKGVGSDTVQKMSMSNLINEAGLPSWISSIARVPGGYAKAAGNFLYGQSDEAMRNILADTLRDPQKAAEALRNAGVPPSKIAEILRVGAQGSAFAVPAIVQGQQ
jgi:hypothetical protein